MSNETENRPTLGLGEFLRTERERKSIALEQVASATKISIKLLHALESDNYDALPAKPFVRGFVSSYARYIGVDPRELMTRFELFLDEKTSKKFKRPENQPHIFVEKEGQSDNSKTTLTILMVGFLVVAVIAFAVLKPSFHHGRGHHKKTSEQAAAPATPSPEPSASVAASEEKEKPEVKIAPAAAAETVEAPKPSPTPSMPKPTPTPTPVAEQKAKTAPTPTPLPYNKIPPLPDKEVRHRLTVKALEDAWVKYQVDDRPLLQFTLRKDKKIYIRARNSIRFSTGKPSALEISIDNKEFKPFDTSTRSIVVPQSLEEQYKENPFVPPNPIYLSTPKP